MVWPGKGSPEGEDRIQGSAQQLCPPCGLINPGNPMACLLEGADSCHLGPTVRTGHDSPVWSLHFRNCHNNWGWSSKALLFLYLFSRPCKLPISTGLWTKDTSWPSGGPGSEEMAQGQWHRSHPVLRREACSSALISSFLYSRAVSSFSHRPHRCYLLCWPRRGAAEPRLGIPKVSCMSISCLLLCSDLLILMLNQTVCFTFLD